jgi:hypothetical protein
MSLLALLACTRCRLAGLEAHRWRNVAAVAAVGVDWAAPLLWSLEDGRADE